MCGWLNKTNSVEAYLPKRTILLKNLKDNIGKRTLALVFLEFRGRRILELMRGFDL